MVCVCDSFIGVGEVGLFCLFGEAVTRGVQVSREQHVVGDARSLRLFVVGSARVGPSGVVQVMLSCFASCRISVSVSSIKGMFVFCCGM